MVKKVLQKSSQALLIVDMINKLDFPEGLQLLRQALPVARNIVGLKSRAKASGIPVIYANDNFGQWQSSWEDVYRVCAADNVCGEPLAKMLKPEKDDYFVLKPKHSAFYATDLEVLLAELNVRNIIITGIAGNICVLFTANDAHMRGLAIKVPEDCIASNTRAENNWALRQMKTVLKVSTAGSESLRFHRA
jgi:nicotinamidase-related amidase